MTAPRLQVEPHPKPHPRLRMNIVAAAVAAVVLCGYGWLLFANCTGVAGGSDSSGYMNEAFLLAENHVVRESPARVVFTKAELELLSAGDRDRITWAFSPLGFKPGPRRNTMVPTYPPGLPLHMVLSNWVFGWELGPTLVSPLACLLSLVLFYLVARQMGLSLPPAVAGALILAAWPQHIRNGLQPMSDCLATFWALATVLGGLLARRHAAWSLLCGAAFGMGVLVRPNSILLCLPVLFLLPWRPRQMLLFLAGGLPFGVFFLAFNHHVYGSAFTTGYGDTSAELAWAYFGPRALHYAGWLALTLTPLLPLAWLLLPLDRRVAVRDRLAVFLWFAPLMLFYCCWKSYDAWWYMRFLAPGVPALILAGLLLVRDGRSWLAQRWAPFKAWPKLACVVPAVALVLILSVEIVQTAKRGVLNLRAEEQRYRSGCVWAAGHMTGRPLVVCMQISGALKYYTQAIPVRWDIASRDDFEAMRTLAEHHGYRWYALLAPFEEHDRRWTEQHVPAGWEKIATSQGGDWSLWQLAPGPGKRATSGRIGPTGPDTPSRAFGAE